MTANTRPERGTLRSVGGAISWSVISQLITQAFGIATSIIIVRSLGRFSYGVFSLLRSLLTFAVALGRGGLTESMLRYFPELRLKQEGAGMKTLLLTVVKFQAILSVLVVLCGWLLREELAELFRKPELAGLMAVGLGLAVFEVYHETINKSAIALYETKTVAWSAALGSILTLGILLLFVKLGWMSSTSPPAPSEEQGILAVRGIVAVLIATAAGHVLAAGLVLRRVIGNIRKVRARTGASIRLKRLFNYALPFLAVNVMVLITWRQSETVFLSYYWTPVEAGLFDLAYRLPQRMLEFVPGAIYPLVMAGFSEAISKDLDSMRRGIVTYYKLLFFLVAPISLFGMLYADRVIEVMYGQQMAASGPLSQVFFFVFMSSFFGTPLSMAIYAIEKTWANMLFYLVSTVIIIGLDLLLIPPYGLWGAMIPVTVITVLSPFARYLLARRLVGGIVIPWSFIARMYMASLPLALFVPLKSRVDSPAMLLGLCVLVGLTVLAGLRVFQAFGEEEKELLARSNLPFRSVILRIL